jgi:hypothetical protein
VPEAGDVDVEFGHPAEGLDGAGAIEVEHAEDDVALGLGDGVAGEEDAVFRQMDGDAAVGMAGNGQYPRATAEIEDLAVLDLLIDLDRRAK